MAVERYSHVDAHGELGDAASWRDGKDALDALVATFPAGTLSGAPKIRAMEIIDELEPARAAALYGGALGYFDLRGNLDFCIAIRTLVFDGGTRHGAGGRRHRGRLRPGGRGARDRGQGGARCSKRWRLAARPL